MPWMLSIPFIIISMIFSHLGIAKTQTPWRKTGNLQEGVIAER